MLDWPQGEKLTSLMQYFYILNQLAILNSEKERKKERNKKV